MREFASPLTINAANVTSAILSGRVCGFAGSTKLTVVNGTGTAAGKATLTLPANVALPQGVYELLVRTDCGCFYSPVFTRCAGAPTMPAQNGYDGEGGTGGDPIPTCPSEPTCPECCEC